MARSNDKSTLSVELHMPLANVNPEPRPFQEYVSEVPKGPVAVVKPALYQYTRRSTKRKLKGNAVMAAYLLKHQSQEPVFAIGEIYSIIRDLVFNFDRTHEESFFEAYPHLLLRDNYEEQGGIVIDPVTRLELRRDYRKYANRLAHYFFYYSDLRTRWVEQLVNLLSFTRFNGEVRDKDIASLARWSQINRRTALHNAFLTPKGVINEIMDAAKYAIGSGANGQTILALPLIDSSIYGNVGNHAGSLKEYVTDSSLYNSDPAEKGSASCVIPTSGMQINGQAAPEYTDEDELDALIFKRNQNIQAAAYHRISSFPILNAATMSFNTANGTIHVPLAEPSVGFNASKEATESTALTDIVWHNIKVLEDIIQAEFPEMRDPNNDLYQFAANQLGLFEVPTTVERMLNAVRDTPFYDITSLRSQMMYRNKGDVNTATVVGQALPITIDSRAKSPFDTSYVYPGRFNKQFRSNQYVYESRRNGGVLATFRSRGEAGGYDVINALTFEALEQITTLTYNRLIEDATATYSVTSGGSTTYFTYAKTLFEHNFERYSFDKEDAFLWLTEARRFPGVTPRIFTRASFKYDETDKPIQPIIMNTISSDGPMLATNAGFQDSGKYATMLDQATRSNLDTQNAVVDFNGVTSEDALRLTDRKDGFICYERPEQVWKYQKPMLDTSDPYQCGFYLLISGVPSGDQSEIASAFVDADHFILAPTSANANVKVVDYEGKSVIGSDIAFRKEGNGVKTYEALFTTAGNTPHYSMLFVGDGIFLPPQALSIQDSYALPYETSKTVAKAVPASTDDIDPSQTMVAAILGRHFDVEKAEEASIYSQQGAGDITAITNIATRRDMLLLFRLASNAVSFDAADTRAVKLTVDQGSSTVAAIKPAAMIATLLADLFNTDGAVRLYMFNPQYGPIGIVTAPLPIASAAHVTPDRQSVADIARGNSGLALQQIFGAFSDTPATIDSNDRLAFISTKTNSHLWSWWLRRFTYNQAYCDNRGSPVVVDRLPVELDDAIRAKWALALYEAASVNYAGVGDMKYFHDYQKGAAAFKPSFAASTTSNYPEQSIVTAPRRSTASVQQHSANFSGKDRSTSSFSTSAVKAAYVDHEQKNDTGNSESSFDAPKSFKSRRHQRRRGKARTKSTFDKDLVKGPTDSPVLPIEDLKAKDDGPFDSSSKDQDKDVKIREKVKPNAVSLQN